MAFAPHTQSRAAKLGADACLLVVPYYNKPTQEGLYRHFKTIAESVPDVSQILYNMPGRTACDMLNETVERLADIPNIVGIKDATGNIPRGVELIKAVEGRLAVYSGDDDLALPTVALGADGLISVIANAAPGPVAELVRRALEDDLAGARALHFALLDAMRASFHEANPGPLKAVLAAQGRMEPTLRLPLAPLTEAGAAHVLAAYAAVIEAGRAA